MKRGVKKRLRQNRVLVHDGVTDTLKGWSVRTGIPYKILWARLDAALPVDRILHTGSLNEGLKSARRRRVSEGTVETHVPPPRLPHGISPELAAMLHLITADEYLDCCGEPRRTKQ